jgi:hypothetical protein
MGDRKRLGEPATYYSRQGRDPRGAYQTVIERCKRDCYFGRKQAINQTSWRRSRTGCQKGEAP